MTWAQECLFVLKPVRGATKVPADKNHDIYSAFIAAYPYLSLFFPFFTQTWRIFRWFAYLKYLLGLIEYIRGVETVKTESRTAERSSYPTPSYDGEKIPPRYFRTPARRSPPPSRSGTGTVLGATGRHAATPPPRRMPEPPPEIVFT